MDMTTTPPPPERQPPRISRGAAPRAFARLRGLVPRERPAPPSAPSVAAEARGTVTTEESYLAPLRPQSPRRFPLCALAQPQQQAGHFPGGSALRRTPSPPPLRYREWLEVEVRGGSSEWLCVTFTCDAAGPVLGRPFRVNVENVCNAAGEALEVPEASRAAFLSYLVRCTFPQLTADEPTLPPT